MASGFPGRDLRGGFGFGFGYGPAVQVPCQQRSDGGAASGLLKRPVSEMERLQEALFLRSVKQKTQFASPTLSNPLTPAAFSSVSNISTPSVFLPSMSSIPALPNCSIRSFPATSSTVEAEMEKKSTMANRLLELERQLLEDDDEEEQVSVSGSVITNCEWRDAIQKLISSPSTATVTNQHSMSSSPTNSSSSSSGSSFSITQSTPSPSRQMLLDTATAISEGDRYTAAANLAILKRAANPRGDPDQRLTSIMIEALVSRLNPRDPMITLPITDVCSSEHHSAVHMLHESSPCFKLGLIAANFAILESAKDHTKIHILDFDVGRGGQLASFINAVSERQSLRSPRWPPISVKITAVSDISFPFFPHTAADERHLCTVGDRLATLAKHLGVGFRFNIVKRKIHELDSETLGCEAGEALAVNLAFLISRVADESVSPANPRDELLRRVKSLKPKVVTLVEQEINGNTAPFATRFAEACAHYGALLESLDATSNRESTGRAGIEACLARKAANSIAHEGPDRVERCEVYGKWRARMGMAGFQTLHLGPTVVEPLKLRLASLRNNPGFMLKEEAGRLGCGWMGRVLTVASAWR